MKRLVLSFLLFLSFSKIEAQCPTLTAVSTSVTCNGGNNGSATVTVAGGTPGFSYTWAPSGGNAATASNLTGGVYTVTVTDAASCVVTKTVLVAQPNFFVAVQTHTNSLCYGNPATVSYTVIGGTPGYTYTWSPYGGNSALATGLSPGTFTFFVKDQNNCTLSDVVTVIGPSFPVGAIMTQTNNTCGVSTGGASVQATGGTPGYTYTWSPSGGNNPLASLTTTGLYTVTITDANSCTATSTVNFLAASLPTLSVGFNSVACNGGFAGTATVTTAGGMGPFTYTWSPTGGNSNTASFLAAANYTISVTDAASCLRTATFAILEPPPLVATTTQTNILCNAGTGHGSVTVSGGIGPYTYTWSPSGGNSPLSGALTAGQYSVSIRDANQCLIIKNFTFTQPPAMVIAGSQTNIICGGSATGAASVSVSNAPTPYSYTWTPSGGNAALASALVAGVYTVTVADNNTCTATSIFTITQTPPIIATITSSSVTCNGSSNGSASLTVSGGTGSYTYSWSPSGGVGPIATGLTANTYSVKVTDAASCSKIFTVLISQPAVLSSTLTKANITCHNLNDGTATLTATGGTGTYSYLWTGSASTSSTAGSFAGGTYTATAIDANLCSTSQSFTIVNPPQYTISAASTSLSCGGGSTGSGTVTVSGGAPAYTYSWTPAGGTGSVATNLAAGNYSVQIKDAGNCIVIQTLSIIGPPPPTGTAVASNTLICSGISTTLTASGNVSYTWSPAGNLSSPNGSLVTATPTISTIYSVTASDINGCTVTNTISIQVNQGPALSPSLAATNMCAGNTGTLSAFGALSYTWSPAAGLSNPNIFNPTLTLSNGVYSVSGTDAQGCTSTATIAVSPLPAPSILAISSTSAICLGRSATLTATGALTFTWNTGAAQNTVEVTSSTSTVYTVDGTGPNGCVASASVMLTVNPLPTVSISSGTFMCQGNTATLTASGASTYSWSTGSTAATMTDSPNTSTNYSVTGLDVNNCGGNATFSITVAVTPTITIAGKREVCKYEKFTLNVSGASSYSWSTGETGTTSVTYTLESSTVVTVSSAQAPCPPRNATFSINVNALPVVGITTASTSIRIGQFITLNGTSDSPQYTWTPADNLSCTSCLNPAVQPTTTTIYMLTASNSKLCKNTATLQVLVDDNCGEVFAPTAFSPNEDGNNDTWCIYGPCIHTIDCEIYNRWGQKVFSMSGKEECWDGKINGIPQEPGVFIFQAKTKLINGQTKSLKGNFILVR